MNTSEMVDLLASAKIESPLAEAASLLDELLGGGRARWLIPGTTIPEHPELDAILTRRLAGEPLAYIFQHAYFMNLTLEVSPATLIPRPETELLAEWCIEHLPRGGAILDLGTGSGAIALSVAHARPDAVVSAVDLSMKALEIARRNAECHNLGNNVEFFHGDLFAPLAGRQFDLVAANLPYVSFAEYAVLPRSVREFEPESALTADDDGLALIFRAASSAPDFLRPGGWTIWEMGETQGERLKAHLLENGWNEVEIRRDLCGRDRFVIARRKDD